MKNILYNSIRGVSILAVVSAFFSSCSEDFPSSVESKQFADIESIRIVNAGAGGNQILEGNVDELTKIITFPRLDTLTDFSKLKFEATTSNGSKLEQDEFSVPYQSGDTEKSVYLKVVNSPRFKEYRAQIRFKVAVLGADFTLPKIYDYSSNPLGNPPYASFTGQSTRGTGFDGEHILIVNRGAGGTHLLKVEDLKHDVITRIPLNMTSVGEGTLTYNMGAQINGHTYVANLSGGKTSPLKLYHWSTPSQVPDLVAKIDVNSLAGAGDRHGDNLSVNVDKDGNGYAFFLCATAPIIRLKITNFSVGSEPTVITPQINYEQWGHFNRVGETDSYILSGHSKPMALVTNTASTLFTAKATTFPIGSSDFRVIQFNGERYLLAITVNRGAPNGTSVVMNIYNITKGGNMVDALTAFEQGEMKAVFTYMISGVTNTAPGTQANFYVQKGADGKDEKLLVYGAGTDAGFAIVEFPINTDKEE
ncbi:DUF4623 domain-containing protein [Sphingobacterium paucimobilis]|uniref:DUF4623 domain-containing protein n=1 Tax=Sphingobacterium paucimobilis HER1398 TaxID=1346330 RepID=U2H848_9SPHI|nr:DUF4623 domain-containing protein [Sphingobacterium paucimobilis]ERJ57891.1 hypothetical protein M472_03835 [Sphingobacterium paucimobilis HER1398]ERJ60342.1 hypothetical protein M472_16405 [Sphingobacterium paucimobilis HER1398]